MKQFDLSGKTALVTGGSRGLWRGIVLALAEAGTDIVVTSRTEEELETIAEEVSQLSRNVSINL